MNNNNKNILFFSNYCQHCKEVLEKINNYNLKEQINLNCVDNNRKNLPAFLKSVPTMVIPLENKLVVGDDVFSWINNEISKKTTKNESPLNNNEEISPWTNEMNSSFSDSFSFLDSDNTTEGKPLAHSFSFLNESYSTSINTPNEGQSIDNGMKSGLDNDYDAMMKSRDNDNFNKGISRI